MSPTWASALQWWGAHGVPIPREPLYSLKFIMLSWSLTLCYFYLLILVLLTLRKCNQISHMAALHLTYPLYHSPRWVLFPPNNNPSSPNQSSVAGLHTVLKAGPGSSQGVHAWPTWAAEQVPRYLCACVVSLHSVGYWCHRTCCQVKPVHYLGLFWWHVPEAQWQTAWSEKGTCSLLCCGFKWSWIRAYRILRPSPSSSRPHLLVTKSCFPLCWLHPRAGSSLWGTSDLWQFQI